MAVNLRTSDKFTTFLRHTLGRFLTMRYEIYVENHDVVLNQEPPFALLPNHVGFWDPFFVGIFSNQAVQYVVSDMQFRVPILKFLLTLVGAIPKSKAVSDFETVRNIFRVKKMRGVVGIFPEGMRNWNGCSNEPLYTTSKLIKSLKIPVIVPILKGAYMVLPRWSRKRNKGPITIDFKFVFSVEDLKKLSVDEIQAKLSQALSYNEWDYQRKHKHVYKGRKRAEHIELALFICPHCESAGTLRSRGQNLTCLECGYAVYYNEYGLFEALEKPLKFDNIKDWDDWQLTVLTGMCESAIELQVDDPLFRDGRCVIWRGYRREPMEKYVSGSLSLFHDRFEFDTDVGEKITHTLEQVHGINVQRDEVMEYYVDDTLYTFRFTDPWVSGYKWMAAVNIFKGKNPVNADFLG